MPKFRKKPVVIEAFRWTGETPYREWPHWLQAAWHTPSEQAGALYPVVDSVLIATLEGSLVVSVGDWIIKGVAGELYPCKPEIFAATYEPVEG